MRAGEARGCRRRPSSSVRRTARPTATSGSTLGRRADRRRLTASSTSRAGIPSRPGAILPAEAPGGSTTSSATAGSGRAPYSRRFQAFTRCLVPGVLGRLLRRRAFRHERRVAGDGRELIRPTFRNWFRPRYPYVYATFRCARSAVMTLRSSSPKIESRAGGGSAVDFASDVAYYLTLDPRQLPSRYSTMRSGRRCSKPSACCPGTGSRGPRHGCSKRIAQRDLPSPRHAVVDDRGARVRAAAKSSRARRGRSPRAGHAGRASGRRLVAPP